MFRKTFYFLFVSAYCLSCKQDLNPLQYRSWYYENQEDFIKSEDFGDYKVALVDKPLPVVTIENQSRNAFNPHVFEDQLELKKNLRFFELRFQVSGSKDFLSHQTRDESEYNAKLQYFLSDPIEDIFLKTRRDTLRPVAFHYERGNNVKPYQSVLLAFDFSNSDLPPHEAEGELHFYEKVLGTAGIKMPIRPLNQLPNLILDYD
ncbi:MAG: hypothetical protein NXI09_15550 [Bacteroidetes bacterium]|nr:hypothetical protein [Bacteroidota bacterium]